VARNDGHEPGGALVVLVNHRTTSASELVAAAIKNLGRGVVVGEPTAGAAAIRVLFDIPRGPLRQPPSRHAASDRAIVQDVIDGKAPAPVPPLLQPEATANGWASSWRPGACSPRAARKSEGSA